MSRARKRADRIRAEIPIARVLSDYGYNVNPDAGDRAQQFSCDLHGSGRDTKPSARVYPDNGWYCFGCGRPRDAIQTCREKEGLDFWGAVKTLERRYHLPEMPWEEDEAEVEPASFAEKLRDILAQGLRREDVVNRVRRRIEIATEERELPMDTVLKAWEDFDRIVYGLEHEGWSDNKGLPLLLCILEVKP